MSTEASFLQPIARQALQAGQSVAKNWTRINEADGDLRSIFGQLRQLQIDVASKIPTRTSYGLFPFRIYSLPDYLRDSPDPATDWLKFRVRAGAVFINWLQVTPTGTDGAPDPDDESFPDVADITATVNVPKFWFWLVLTSSTAVVSSGASPPTWDSTHIPIGYVDTQTHLAGKIAIARQFLRTDIYTCI